MYQHILDQLTDLKLKGLKEAYQRQSQTPSYLPMPFEERLAHLIDAEMIYRQNGRINQYLRSAKLKYRTACLEDIEYLASRNLERSMIASLAKNQWIQQQHNIVIQGATGTGKTYLACALAHNAIIGGYSASYARVSKLLSEVKAVRADGSYLSFLKRLTKMRVLILDDFGVAPMDTRDAQELLEIIEDRVGSGSTIITSQLPVESWHDYLSNGTVADAVLDRLVHNAYRLNLEGDTLRKRNKPELHDE